MPTPRQNRVTKKKIGDKSAPKSAPLKSKSAHRKSKSAPLRSKSAPFLPYSHESNKSHSTASDSDSLRYGPMSETESQSRLKPYDKFTPSSEGSVTQTDVKHYQEKPYLDKLIESSGVDRTIFINYLKRLNRTNKKNINNFFMGNFTVPDRGEQYNNMVDLLEEDPRVNELVCEAALMKE